MKTNLKLLKNKRKDEKIKKDYCNLLVAGTIHPSK